MTSFEQEHDVLEGLLGAYALDAVEADEAAALERHLMTCPRCRAELDQHREVAGALGNSVEILPADLWDRIAERLERAPRHGVEEPPDLPARPGTAESGRVATWSERPGGARAHRVRRWLTTAAVAAAIAVIAVLSVNAWSAHERIGTLQSALSGTADNAAVQAALAAPGHTTVRLRSVGGAQLATLVMLPDGRGYMIDSTMPRLPAGETYQLWAIIEGRPISAGLLGSHPTVATFTVASRRPSAMAVTIEPAVGASRPSGPAVASGYVVAT